MNLRDYIGETRTESLPAGFLRSIKIKYRHEESHVFPRAVGPSSRESKRVEIEPTVEDSGENKEEDDDKASEIKEKQLPGFMSWSVPSRLLNQIQEKEHIASDEKVDETNADLKIRDDGTSITRELTSLSIRGLKSSTSTHSHSCDEFKVDRQSSGGRKSNSVEYIHKSQPNAREGSGTISPTRLQRRQKSEGTVRSAAKSSVSQPSEKSKVEVRECKSGGIVQNTSCSKRSKVNNESERELTSNCSRNKSDMLVKENVRVLKSSSLKMGNGSDNQDNKSERNATSKRSVLISEHKLKELPKLHVSLPKRNPKSSKVEENGRLLPHLKRAKGKTTSTTEQNETPSKLPQTPERIEKINTWIKKSTHKERKAAFNLLSTFITSEKINSSRARKERIKIALKALERKDTSGKPLRLNDTIRNLAVITLDQQRSTKHMSNDDQATKRQREALKTWHHMPACHDTGALNKSAMFAEPSKSHQRHFSIHPEWGLHTQVNKAKC